MSMATSLPQVSSRLGSTRQSIALGSYSRLLDERWYALTSVLLQEMFGNDRDHDANI